MKKTQSYNLILLDKKESTGTWGDTLNSNFIVVDEIIKGIQDEVLGGRGSLSSLNSRLNVVVSESGVPQLHPNIVDASLSLLYNISEASLDSSLHSYGKSDFSKRLGYGEYEIAKARAQANNLIDGISGISSGATGRKNQILSAPFGILVTSIGTSIIYIEPPSGSDVFEAIVNGKYCTIQTLNGTLREDPLNSVKLDTSGLSDGFHYVYISQPTSGVNRFESLTGALNITAEDQFEIVGGADDVSDRNILVVNDTGSLNRGRYVIESYASPTGTIKGEFVAIEDTPGTEKEFFVFNPFHPGGSGFISVDDPIPADVLIIGEIKIQSGTVLDWTSYTHAREIEILIADIGGDPPSVEDFFSEYSITHNFGEIPKEVIIFAKQSGESGWSSVPVDRPESFQAIDFSDNLGFKTTVGPTGVKGFTGSANRIVPPCPLVQDIFPTGLGDGGTYTKNIFLAIGDAEIRRILIISDKSAAGDATDHYEITVKKYQSSDELQEDPLLSHEAPIVAGGVYEIIPGEGLGSLPDGDYLQLLITQRGAIVSLEDAKLDIVVECAYDVKQISLAIEKTGGVKASEIGQAGLMTLRDRKTIKIKTPSEKANAKLYMAFDRTWKTSGILKVIIRR